MREEIHMFMSVDVYKSFVDYRIEDIYQTSKQVKRRKKKQSVR